MKYKVQFVDLSVQYKRYGEESIAAIRSAMARGDYILRGDLEQFEKTMASYFKVKHVIGLGSGTDALFLALKAAGIKEGDEVITVGFTCVATLAAIANCGAKPILVDVTEDYNMDVDQVEQVITKRTKAILPVHLNGRVCQMGKLMDIASKHNLIVIEDAAQAIGAFFDKQEAGTFGLAGCFSLYPMKIFGAAGDGGFVTTNDDTLAERILQLRDLGQNRETGDINCFGYNSRLDNIQAAILNVKFKYLEEWIERRRGIASMYNRGLFDLSELTLPHQPDKYRHFYDVFQNYVIRTKERDKLVKHLNNCKIEVLTSWYLSKPLHYHKALDLTQFKLPKTEQFAKECISIPLNTEISNEQVNYVIKSIRDFYGQIKNV